MDLKRNKTFKVFITLIVIIFIISVISCKEVPAVVEEQQEEKGEVTIPFETKEETKPVEEPAVDSALEAILKEKVSFISEVLPGAELNTKTGELTAKAGNEWGIKEGESIGWYVVKAFKMETADGVEEEQDAVGLIPPVIEAMQNKIFEEKGEKPSPIPINLKETEDVKITELKINAGIVSGVSTFGINVPVGAIVYTPLSGEYNLSSLSEATEIETKDKSVGGSYDSDLKKEGEGIVHLIGVFSIDFVEDNNIIFDINDIKTKAIPIEDGEEILINFYELKLGDPLIEITGSTFLDQTANKFDDIWLYENPGNYQLRLEHLKHFFEGYGPPVSTETVDLLSLKRNQESEVIKVFILPNETAHEQTK